MSKFQATEFLQCRMFRSTIWHNEIWKWHFCKCYLTVCHRFVKSAQHMAQISAQRDGMSAYETGLIAQVWMGRRAQRRTVRAAMLGQHFASSSGVTMRYSSCGYHGHMLERGQPDPDVEGHPLRMGRSMSAKIRWMSSPSTILHCSAHFASRKSAAPFAPLKPSWLVQS